MEFQGFMNGSATKGWRVFFAHLTELGIWFVISGIVYGFFFEAEFHSALLTVFITAFLLSVAVGSISFAIFGTTLCEWLYGCQIMVDDPRRKFFWIYLMHRLGLRRLPYTDCRISVVKYLTAFILLFLVLYLIFAL